MSPATKSFAARTSLMWRFLAPKLAANHSVVCVDRRAYGRGGIPPAGKDHFAYSKRAMANELIEVMAKRGFSTFTLIGHDRGGRVAYRMALDHPMNVQRLAVFDVIPILEAWSGDDRCRTRSRRQGGCQANRMPHVSSVGRRRSPRYVLRGRGRFVGDLASMGAARRRKGDEGWPFFPGREC